MRTDKPRAPRRLPPPDFRAVKIANAANLYLLVDGPEGDRVYVYFDRSTGRELGRFYPTRGRLLVNGSDPLNCTVEDATRHLATLVG